MIGLTIASDVILNLNILREYMASSTHAPNRKQQPVMTQLQVQQINTANTHIRYRIILPRKLVGTNGLVLSSDVSKAV